MNKDLIRFFKWVVFAAIIYFIFKMVKNRNSFDILKRVLLDLKWQQIQIILLVFILQFLNWGIEAFKFKLILQKKAVLSFKKSLISIYIGNASSLFTPDRLGNFIGRAFYLRNIDKLIVTSASMLGNLAQLWSTLIFALVGTILFISTSNRITVVYNNIQIILALLVLLNSVVFSIYYYPKVIVSLLVKVKWLKKYRPNFFFLSKYSTIELTVFLCLSLFRYLIFIIQFYLLLYAFGLQLYLVEVFIFIGLLYFVTTFVPSPVLGNLGTRELVSIYLLSSFSQPEIVLLSSLSIWLINVIFPALLGFVLAFKLYKKTL